MIASNPSLRRRPRFALTGPLSRRIYLACLLAAAVPTAVAGAVGIYYSIQALRVETLRNLQQEVGVRAEGIGRFFEQLHAELAYLSRSEPLTRFLAAQGSDTQKEALARAALEQDYANLAAWYPHIYQIRVLSADGRERVRVDRREGRVEVVPTGRLQDKSDRYYFIDAMQRGPGEVYVSPLDLKVELGAIRLALALKPERHQFHETVGRAVPFMTYTGG